MEEIKVNKENKENMKENENEMGLTKHYKKGSENEMLSGGGRG